MLHLKSVVTQKNRVILIGFVALALSGLFILSGTFYIGEAIYLPMTPFEESIPLMIWTTWIYAALYPYIFIGLISYSNLERMNRIFYLYMTCQVTACLIFFFFPTEFPEAQFYRDYDGTASTYLWKLIKGVDVPVNCFPSLHVSNCFLISFGYLEESRKKFLMTFMMSVLISISTLTTKQHYALDIFGGLALALILYFGLGRFIKIKGPAKAGP